VEKIAVRRQNDGGAFFRHPYNFIVGGPNPANYPKIVHFVPESLKDRYHGLREIFVEDEPHATAS
jgi:hypothetical protein